MTPKLLLQALTKFFLGFIIMGLLIFLPARSLHYWQGWLLMGILFVPMFIAGIVMMIKNPELLQKRLNAKEQEKEQKTVVALSGLLFVAAFVVAGLNWRFQWLVLPNWAVWVAAALFLLCYVLYAEVLRENTYLSRTIEVQEHQKVVDTGLYGVVRHPMYMATTILFLMMPLVLASGARSGGLQRIQKASEIQDFAVYLVRRRRQKAEDRRQNDESSVSITDRNSYYGQRWQITDRTENGRNQRKF